MEVNQLKKDIETRQLKPVYLFYGTETFLKERYTQEITSVVDEPMRDFNLEILLAEENPAADVVERVQTMPFGAPPKLVIVKGVDRYPADDLNILKDYLDHINDSACLVLVAEKPDMRMGLFKALSAKKLGVNFAPPRGRGFEEWVNVAASDRGCEISPQARRALIEMVGTDLSTLVQELEKVCLYAGPGKKVEVADVKAAARDSKTASVFELGDAVGGQNQAQALNALESLLESEPPLKILAMIVRHFRILFKAKALMAENAGKAVLQKELGLPPFVVGKYLEQATRLDMSLIRKGLIQLMEADLALKSSSVPDSLIMDSLVLKLASLRQVGSRSPY